VNKNVLRRIASLQLQGRNGHDKDFFAILANDTETLARWSLPLTEAERTERNNAIFDHWLAGESEATIAKKGVASPVQAHRIIHLLRQSRLETMEYSESPPVYNVWNYSGCDPRFGQDHPGRIPGQAIINLLLWLTKPFDIVVDPMAGGGTTIDVCRYLLRRYHCFDLDPRRPDIKQWDIRKGYPRLPQKPDLIILDPPYWRLKRDEYSNDSSSMGSYDDWLAFMRKLARDTYNTLKHGGHTALFIQSFMDEWESHKYIFANRDCLNLFETTKFEGVMEVALNIPSQVKSFRDVTWAKRNNKLLSLKRDILVFRKV
jgi:hypothetical protein